MTLLDRFLSKVSPEPNTGCWLWDAGSNKPRASDNERAYGKIRIGSKKKSAHRVSWILHRGPIPPGKHVLHSCDIPCCVNPDHLFLGNHAVNMADMAKKGRSKRGQTWRLEPTHAAGTAKSYRRIWEAKNALRAQ